MTLSYNGFKSVGIKLPFKFKMIKDKDTFKDCLCEWINKEVRENRAMLYYLVECLCEVNDFKLNVNDSKSINELLQTSLFTAIAKM